MLLKKKHLFDSKIHYFQVHFIRKRKPENRFLPLASIEIGHALEKSIYVFFN